MIVSNDPENPSPSSLILYQADDQTTRIEVRLDAGTVWLTQAQLAELFQTTPQNITLHLKAVYEEGELSEEATCKSYLQVRQEGGRDVSRNLRHYNLEAILATAAPSSDSGPPPACATTSSPGAARMAWRRRAEGGPRVSRLTRSAQWPRCGRRGWSKHHPCRRLSSATRTESPSARVGFRPTFRRSRLQLW